MCYSNSRNISLTSHPVHPWSNKECSNGFHTSSRIVFLGSADILLKKEWRCGYPRRTGNEIWVHRPDAQEGIPPSRLTLAELFKDAATACIGKRHLGFQEQFLPKNPGFDHYFGILHNIATGPGIRKGVESHVVAHAMDWYPTLASLAGISIPEGVILDARDLGALLLGKTDTIPAFDRKVSLNAEIPLRREFHQDREWERTFTRGEYLNAFFYHGSHGALSAVRSEKWKLTLNPSLTLYALEKDPGERMPVDNWEIKTKLRGMVVQFQREMSK